MRKKVFICALAIMMAAGAATTVFFQHSKAKNILLLDNVEALAEKEEGIPYKCEYESGECLAKCYYCGNMNFSINAKGPMSHCICSLCGEKL